MPTCPVKTGRSVFGDQIVANDADEVVAENPRLLIGATGLSVEQIVRGTHGMGGLCLAAHIDRPANGIISQLGFIPPRLALDGLEVSARIPLARAREILPEVGSRPCLTSSDAHRLADIGRVSHPDAHGRTHLRGTGPGPARRTRTRHRELRAFCLVLPIPLTGWSATCVNYRFTSWTWSKMP